MNCFEDLNWRGLIKDIAGENLREKLNEQRLTFYWGTDPTAGSLHLGHYSSLVMAKRLSMYGHNPILLVGGATGLIGDPRPSAEREIIDKEVLNKYFEGIKKQVTKIIPSAKIVNNYDWFKDYNYLEFLRDIGKYININYMINKDIISRRLESGITYAEFSYMLVQGYDFLYLFRNEGCTLQVAGSDQWGNITTGVELIRKAENKEALAFTMPLVEDKYGNKFGKSEGNALWLDLNLTSSYELYQFLINVSDEKVVDYLKIFTFLDKEKIDALEKSNINEPHLREAHKALAREIITDLHGESEYLKALTISEKLFNQEFTSLSTKDILLGLKDVPNFTIKENETVLDMLVNNEIVSSKREGRELLTSNSISINGEVVTDENRVVTKELLLDNKLIVVRKGKKKYFLGIKKS